MSPQSRQEEVKAVTQNAKSLAREVNSIQSQDLSRPEKPPAPGAGSDAFASLTKD